MLRHIEPRIRIRIFVLIPGCLAFILTAIVLMSLQVPVGEGGTGRRAARSERARQPIAERTTGTEAGSSPEASNEIRSAPVASVEVAAYGAEVNDVDLEYLRRRNLVIPVYGKEAKDFRDSFDAPRSEGRLHRAVDIMAADGTPVIASASGRLKLHTSEKGGIMIYEIDSSGPYVYCYGHLQRYAEGVYEGKVVTAGDVIGYVGDTGNAGAGNFHLHFGISKMAAPGKWSGGAAINPYPLLTGEP